MTTVLLCAALARKIERDELRTIESFAAIVGKAASDNIRAGADPITAYRNALNEALDLIRSSIRDRAGRAHHD